MIEWDDSRLGWVVFGGGLTGIASGLALEWWVSTVAYAHNAAEFDAEAAFLFAFLGFVVLVSIVLHGVTSTPAMRYLERKWQAEHAPAEGNSGRPSRDGSTDREASPRRSRWRGTRRTPGVRRGTTSSSRSS